MPSKYLTPAVRMGILALLAIAVALSVAAPLRTLVRQSDENAQLAAEVSDREGHIAELESELAKWKDPAFVEQQVRDRLHKLLTDTRIADLGHELEEGHTFLSGKLR